MGLFKKIVSFLVIYLQFFFRYRIYYFYIMTKRTTQKKLKAITLYKMRKAREAKQNRKTIIYYKMRKAREAKKTKSNKVYV